MAKKNMGRPSALTDATIEEVSRLAAQAPFYDTIAAMLGIHMDTFRGWLRTGRRTIEVMEKGDHEPTEHEARCVKVFHTLKKARAESESALLELVRTAAQTQWTAACRLLEILNPSRYAQNRHELNAMCKEIKELEARIAGAPGKK